MRLMLFAGALVFVASGAASIELVSVAPGGGQANNDSAGGAVTPDGRFVVFVSSASNLVAADTNETSDVFVRDRQLGTVERISVTDAGQQLARGAYGRPSISGDGRFVTFVSYLDRQSCCENIYVHDRETGVNEQISVTPSGGDPDAGSLGPIMTPDGRYVAFYSQATNLTPDSPDDHSLTGYVRDRVLGVTERLGVGPPRDLTSDGRHVLVTRVDGSGVAQAYVVDRVSGSTRLASVNSSGEAGNHSSGGTDISPDGRYVVFTSNASNLVASDANGHALDVFVHDLSTGTTELVDVLPSGVQAAIAENGSISADGRFVSFHTGLGVYLRDRATGTTELASTGESGEVANAPVRLAHMSDDGRFLLFESDASNLVATGAPACQDAWPTGEYDENGEEIVVVEARRCLELYLVDRFASADSDGDGIEDAVDDAAVAGGFRDEIENPPAGTGGVTSGRIVDAAGLSVSVIDAADPDGVTVTVGPGTGQATLSVCGGFELRLAAGSAVIVTCGSVRVAVLTGAAQIVLGEGLTTVSIGAGEAAKVGETVDGRFAITDVDGVIEISVDGVHTLVSGWGELVVAAWDFEGFAHPIDGAGVVNVAKAGRVVPLKWRLLDGQGRPVTTLTSARLTVKTLTCEAGATADQVEEFAAGGSGLQHLGDGYYRLNWHTASTYAGSCKTMHLDLGEGVTRQARFKFVK